MGEGNERVTVSMGDIRLNVERLKNGARVTVWCADGPPREVFAPDEPTPMDDEYLATNNEADNQDGVPERGQLASPGRIGGDKNARIAVCPECQSRDVSVSALNGRRNWCRACGNGYVADVEERRDPAQDAPDGSQAAEDGERGDDTPGDALESHPVADAALGAATMTCPQCGQRTDELRGNRCRVCREWETASPVNVAPEQVCGMPDPDDYSTYMRKDSCGTIRCADCEAPIMRDGDNNEFDVTEHAKGCPAYREPTP